MMKVPDTVVDQGEVQVGEEAHHGLQFQSVNQGLGTITQTGIFETEEGTMKKVIKITIVMNIRQTKTIEDQTVEEITLQKIQNLTLIKKDGLNNEESTLLFCNTYFEALLTYLLLEHSNFYVRYRCILKINPTVETHSST